MSFLSFSEWEKQVHVRLVAARDRAHPAHISHACEEKHVKYFDALMIYVDVSCSCGQTLRIDRDFFEAM